MLHGSWHGRNLSYLLHRIYRTVEGWPSTNGATASELLHEPTSRDRESSIPFEDLLHSRPACPLPPASPRAAIPLHFFTVQQTNFEKRTTAKSMSGK